MNEEKVYDMIMNKVEIDLNQYDEDSQMFISLVEENIKSKEDYNRVLNNIINYIATDTVPSTELIITIKDNVQSSTMKMTKPLSMSLSRMHYRIENDCENKMIAIKNAELFMRLVVRTYALQSIYNVLLKISAKKPINFEYIPDCDIPEITEYGNIDLNDEMCDKLAMSFRLLLKLLPLNKFSKETCVKIINRAKSFVIREDISDNIDMECVDKLIETVDSLDIPRNIYKIVDALYEVKKIVCKPWTSENIEYLKTFNNHMLIHFKYVATIIKYGL